ncbi:MAG: hypothetical protein E7218_08485 [Anaerofustis stercorihominis]|nr:hypothetical protein [Anaerofustis stercorihominis]
MKKSYIILLLLLIFLLGCTHEVNVNAEPEDAVLSYMAEYIPLENLKFGMKLEDVASSLGVSSPHVLNYMVGSYRAKTFDRTLIAREYGGLLRESYYFDSDTLKLHSARVWMSFYAPKKFLENDKLHQRVIDEGIVYIRDFYDMVKEKYESCYGVVLNATSDEITKDTSVENRFHVYGDNGEHYVSVGIYFTKNLPARESNIASKDGSYEYCVVDISVKKSVAMHVLD